MEHGKNDAFQNDIFSVRPPFLNLIVSSKPWFSILIFTVVRGSSELSEEGGVKQTKKILFEMLIVAKLSSTSFF